jgi:hypothetical protein
MVCFIIGSPTGVRIPLGAADLVGRLEMVKPLVAMNEAAAYGP